MAAKVKTGTSNFVLSFGSLTRIIRPMMMRRTISVSNAAAQPGSRALALSLLLSRL